MIETHPLLNDLLISARNDFFSWRGRYPRWYVAAPGRVNLIGEHTDYNDGWVLPIALDRYTVLVAAPSERTGVITVSSRTLEEEGSFQIGEAVLPADPAWLRYIQGVVIQYIKLGVMAAPIDILVSSSLPLGGGLSSSAALEVAMAKLIEKVSGKTLAPWVRIRAAQLAEQECAGVPCGMMDQFIVSQGLKGKAILLDCQAKETTPVPFEDPDVALLVINSGVSHVLGETAYSERRLQCEEAARFLSVSSLRAACEVDLLRLKEDEILLRRARHVLSENQRTLKAADDLNRGDWEALGKRLTQSHLSLRDDFEVSCPELNLLVDLALSETEVLGARMTGGGFGGSVIVLVMQDSVERIAESIRSKYFEMTNRIPVCSLARAAPGADVLDLTI